ncbi:hypothetical protein AAHB54_06520 [Bacillus cereus]
MKDKVNKNKKQNIKDVNTEQNAIYSDQKMQLICKLYRSRKILMKSNINFSSDYMMNEKYALSLITYEKLFDNIYT